MKNQVTYLIGTLDHTLLTLQLDILLLLSVGKSPRDTEQESTGAENPERAAAEGNTRLCERGHVGGCVGGLLAGGGRDNVFQGGETVEKGLGLDVIVGLDGDLGLCNWEVLDYWSWRLNMQYAADE